MNIKLILSTMLAGTAVVFIIQNITPVELTFLFWTRSMSGALLIFLILSAGIFLGLLLHGSFRRLRRNKDLHPSRNALILPSENGRFPLRLKKG